MKNIYNFKNFVIESSSAGNKERSGIWFKYSNKDFREGYNIDDFISDVKIYVSDKLDLKRDIMDFIDNFIKDKAITSIRKLDIPSLKMLIKHIEDIIENGGSPQIMEMPGGSILFLKDRTSPEGKICDLYISPKKTKIEVVSYGEDGEEICDLMPIEEFDPADYGIEGQDLDNFNKLKGF